MTIYVDPNDGLASVQEAGAPGVLSPVPGPLKWHGGKHYLAKRIVELMPPHLHYVEPFFGGGSVLLAKNPCGVSEVVNDLDGRLMNFWTVLRDEETFGRFVRAMEATPFSQPFWQDAHNWRGDDGDADPVGDAGSFYVDCRMSLAGRREDFAPLSRTRTRRGKNEQASAWLSAVDGLADVHARLKRVVILNRPALNAIRQQDGPGTLFYCDPPYPQETRTAKTVYGEFEMTNQDHEELLQVLLGVQGKVLVSGYRSALYDGLLDGWERHEFDLPNNAASGTAKRRMVECVWCNFPQA